MSDTLECVDQLARDVAQRALMMITAHEQRCEQRELSAVGWRDDVNKKLDRIGENIRALYDRNWSVAVGAIVILLGVCGYLIAKHGI